MLCCVVLCEVVICSYCDVVWRCVLTYYVMFCLVVSCRHYITAYPTWYREDVYLQCHLRGCVDSDALTFEGLDCEAAGRRLLLTAAR